MSAVIKRIASLFSFSRNIILLSCNHLGLWRKMEQGVGGTGWLPSTAADWWVSCLCPNAQCLMRSYVVDQTGVFPKVSPTLNLLASNGNTSFCLEHYIFIYLLIFNFKLTFKWIFEIHHFFPPIFSIGSHSVALAVLECALETRLAWTHWSSCVCLLSPGAKGMHHHVWRYIPFLHLFLCRLWGWVSRRSRFRRARDLFQFSHFWEQTVPFAP